MKLILSDCATFESAVDPHAGTSIVDATEVQKEAMRYRWLRSQYAAGEETYLAEGIVSEDQLDEHIDTKLEEEKERE
jgi:hypothetical protein